MEDSERDHDSGGDDENELSSGSDRDGGGGVYAPGVKKFIDEAQDALENGNKEKVREKLSLAHETLISSRADELEMTPAMEEILEETVERDDFADELPLGSEELPDEWTRDEVPLEKIPVWIDRETRDIGEDTLLRITVEPSDRTGNYRARFEVLPF